MWQEMKYTIFFLLYNRIHTSIIEYKCFIGIFFLNDLLMHWGCASCKQCYSFQLLLGDCLSPTIHHGEHDCFIFLFLYSLHDPCCHWRWQKPRACKGSGSSADLHQRPMECDVVFCFSSFPVVWRTFTRGDLIWQSEFSSPLSVKQLPWEICRVFWDLKWFD